MFCTITWLIDGIFNRISDSCSPTTVHRLESGLILSNTEYCQTAHQLLLVFTWVMNVAMSTGPHTTPFQWLYTITLTDLGGGQTLFGQLEDLLFDIVGSEFQPLQVTFKWLLIWYIGSKYTEVDEVMLTLNCTYACILTVGTLRL